jgi:hypothetical protein
MAVCNYIIKTGPDRSNHCPNPSRRSLGVVDARLGATPRLARRDGSRLSLRDEWHPVSVTQASPSPPGRLGLTGSLSGSGGPRAAAPAGHPGRHRDGVHGPPGGTVRDVTVTRRPAAAPGPGRPLRAVTVAVTPAVPVPVSLRFARVRACGPPAGGPARRRRRSGPLRATLRVTRTGTVLRPESDSRPGPRSLSLTVTRSLSHPASDSVSRARRRRRAAARLGHWQLRA